MPAQQKQEDDSLEILLASTEASTPARKVELDLDDAPFLQAEEKEAPLPAHAEIPPEAPADDSAKKRKKKLIILGAAAAGLLLVGAAIAWWFFFRTPPPPGPVPPEPEVIVVPKAATTTGSSDIVREFAPFIVPVKEPDGKTSFLVCQFSSITHDQGLNREIDEQRIALRDAIYFYLRGKDAPFLLDARNGPQIKKDLLSIFNDYLTQGKLEDILFESYLGH